MKKALLSLLFLIGLAAAPARAQVGNTTTIRFLGAPTGSCAPFSFGINSATGDLYDCVGGSWVKVGSGGGGMAGTVTASHLVYASGSNTLSDVAGSASDANGQVTMTATGAARTPLSLIAASMQTATLLSLTNSASPTNLGTLSISGTGLSDCDTFGGACLLNLVADSAAPWALMFHRSDAMAPVAGYCAFTLSSAYALSHICFDGSAAFTQFDQKVDRFTFGDSPIEIDNKISKYNAETLLGEGVPYIPGIANLTGQTGNISSTPLATGAATDGLFRVSANVTCETAVATATVLATITYVDISNTNQSTNTTTAACTTLGAASVGQATLEVQLKAGQQIGFTTTTVNSPHYAVRIAVERLL